MHEIIHNTERLKQEKYNGVETADFFVDVERLKVGEPIDYVLGYTDFLGARVDLSHHPMIPRPETEHWVKQAVAELREHSNPRLIDLFSGSGNIGLGLLKQLPNATVEFSELDPNLNEQILKSVRLNNLAEARVKIFAGDALEGMTGQYDAIFANPPYVDLAAREDLDKDQREYEPQLAFFGKNKGLYHHQLLIENAWNFLVPGGAVYMEADEDQRPYIEEMLVGTPWTYEFWSDQYGQIRFPVLRKIAK